MTHTPEDPFQYPEDKFRHGKISKFSSHSGYGFIRDLAGHEVYFHLDEVRLIDGKKRTDVREHQHVGFDIGLTARGVRATHLKLYE